MDSRESRILKSNRRFIALWRKIWGNSTDCETHRQHIVSCVFWKNLSICKSVQLSHQNRWSHHWRSDKVKRLWDCKTKNSTYWAINDGLYGADQTVKTDISRAEVNMQKLLQKKRKILENSPEWLCGWESEFCSKPRTWSHYFYRKFHFWGLGI